MKKRETRVLGVQINLLGALKVLQINHGVVWKAMMFLKLKALIKMGQKKNEDLSDCQVKDQMKAKAAEYHLAHLEAKEALMSLVN